MADWPILVKGKIQLPIPEQSDSDPTIRSRKEDGSVTTRLRFPAVPKRWEFELRVLSEADKTTLKTFQHTTVSYGAGVFNWTNPMDNTIYVVRLGAPFVFTHDETGDQYRTKVTLVEAAATE